VRVVVSTDPSLQPVMVEEMQRLVDKHSALRQVCYIRA
jgi:hypothetical protein